MGYNESGIINLLKSLNKDDLKREKRTLREEKLLDLISAIITEGVEPGIKIIMAKMMNLQMPVKIIPSENETAVIATDYEKSAALLFDRVWTPYIKDVPKEISFFGNSNIEIDLWSCIRISDIAKGMVKDTVLKERIINNARTMLEMILAGEVVESNEEIIHKSYLSKYPFITFCHQISFLLNSRYNTNIKTLFPSLEDQKNEYTAGDHRVIFACLKDVAVPKEDELHWEQVIELRKDKKSKEKYSKLIHWFDKEMVGKTQEFIKDEIHQKIESYEWTLRKHGIKTIRGVVGKLLDVNTLIKSAVSYGVVSAANIGIDPILGATGYLMGKTALDITDMYINYKDIQIGPNSEIAYLYEIKNKLT